MPDSAATAPAPAATDWHARPISDIARELETDPERGLSAAEAEARLERHGPNALPEQGGRTLLQSFAEQFANFLIGLLLVATVIALAIGEYVDAATIFAIVILSAVLGVVQERRAEGALEALRKMMTPVARVLRDGNVVEVAATSIVPGDVVLLEAGHYVPADLRLTETASLKVNEASLTGESTQVTKDARADVPEDAPVADRENCAFSGTMVTYGHGRGVVVGTGAGTQIGRIATLITSYEQEATPLQRRMSSLGRWLGIGAVVICAAIFAIGSSTGRDLVEMLLVAVSLAVAAVPEGLPAVVTISLALGMQRMARRNALMRRLAAVETLGSATVIASDKTGTLTKGEMTAVALYLGPDLPEVEVTGAGYEPSGSFRRDGSEFDPQQDPHLRRLLEASALCNDARLQNEDGRWTVVGDTTEGALTVLAAKAGIDPEALEGDRPRVAEIPFSSEARRMTTAHRWDEAYLVFQKGAPDEVLPRCTRRRAARETVPLSSDDRDAILAANDALAERGLRVLALAYREVGDVPPDDQLEDDLIFLGLAAIQDPPRPEARDAVGLCFKAGIVPLMITGDHAATALAIARDLRIADEGGRVLTGRDVERMDDGELREALGDVRVFARISPETKVRIVEALRDNGHIVAVTGDGVNDAPALKRADIGAAMGITGTDVAKEAADMVITDDNFASIVAAVEEGRKIFDNIRNFVVLLLSANVGEIILIFGGIVVGLPVPLLAAQILWVNLVTDSLPALALSLERGDPDAMERPPRPPQEPILTRGIATLTVVRGLVEGVGALAAFAFWLYVLDASDDLARSVAFTAVVVAELLEAHGSRSLYRTIKDIGPLSNPWVVWATLFSFVMMVAVLYVPFLQEAFHTEPLGWPEWTAVWAVALVRLGVIEGLKVSPWRLRPPGEAT